MFGRQTAGTSWREIAMGFTHRPPRAASAFYFQTQKRGRSVRPVGAGNIRGGTISDFDAPPEPEAAKPLLLTCPAQDSWTISLKFQHWWYHEHTGCDAAISFSLISVASINQCTTSITTHSTVRYPHCSPGFGYPTTLESINSSSGYLLETD